MLIENHRAILGAVALSLLSCAQKPLTNAVGGARPIASVSGTTMRANPEETVLRFEEVPGHLEIRPTTEEKQLEADAAPTHDGKYVLEIPEGTFPKIERGTFIVREGASRRLVFKGSGFYARWVSDTEVAFLGADGQLTKFDVIDPRKTTRGTRVCGSVLDCASYESPRLEWVSRDLEHAVLRGIPTERQLGTESEPFVVRKGEVAKIATALRDERGLEIRALGVNRSGTLCVFMGPEPKQARTPTDNVEVNKGRLLCAALPWTSWRYVRDFPVNGPHEQVDDDVQVRFFSEREVVVSLPPSKEPTRNEKYRHCLVSLDTAAARCTPNARPEWFPLGDGRWLVEATSLAAPARLIDALRGRSWDIGDDYQAVWWEPHHDSRSPGTLVFQREDKANVRAGKVVLPTEP